MMARYTNISVAIKNSLLIGYFSSHRLTVLTQSFIQEEAHGDNFIRIKKILRTLSQNFHQNQLLK